jgi:N-acetylglucosaminyl-diphospho-decaprenol L-rhamnosyltransferase
VTPELSVVIPVYGGWEMLDRCLAAVERELAVCSPPLRAEIVVADDATPGGIPERFAREHPHVRFLAASRNAGFAGNTNRGAAAARGEILCLLNTDMYVAPGWFDACLAPFADASVFAVCGRIREPSGRNDGYKELVLEGAEVHVRTYQDDEPICDEPAEIPYASGGGSFFRRSAFETLGGFAPVFAPFYWEDTDLGLRAWRRGLRILYDPSRCVEHDHQGTIGANARQRVRRIFNRNRRAFVLRNQTEVALPVLLWRTTLAPALRALARLRLAKAAALLAELAALPGVVHARRDARAHAVLGAAELRKRWSRSS